MLRLTGTQGAIFINPLLVTCVVDQMVRDTDLDRPAANGFGVHPGYKAEGAIICFGGHEDSDVVVSESAETVAALVRAEIEARAA